MDFVDMLLNRIDGESELKKPTHALVCFTRLETGKRLNRMVSDIILSKAEKSLITLLYFVDDIEDSPEGEPVEVFQHKILTELNPKSEKNKITIRFFIREYASYTSEIRKIAEEQGCNLVLIGLGEDEVNIKEADKCLRLMNDAISAETATPTQLNEKEDEMLKQVSSLLENNKLPTGIFHDNGLCAINHIFIPVLCKDDIHIFTFIYQAAQKENVQITVWDAVGIIQSGPKMQKLYQFIVKKSDGRVQLWDDNKKIEKEFIQSQDLLISGIDGWNKLIAAPLSWKESLPSILIIKDSSN